MKTIVNYDNLNEISLYEQLKTELDKQFIVEANEINNLNDKREIKRKLSNCREINEIFNEKLDYINTIKTYDQDKQTLCLETLRNIDNLDFNPKRRLRMMISYGALANYFAKLHDLSFDEIKLLSLVSTKISCDELYLYIGVLSNPDISSSIINKSNNFEVQQDIAHEIMNNQEDLGYTEIGPDNYDELIKNARTLIDNCQIFSK